MNKLVKPESSMDDDTLIRHFNSRHMPIAGVVVLRLRESDPGEKLLRRYHQHVHHRGYEDNNPERPTNHEHAG